MDEAPEGLGEQVGEAGIHGRLAALDGFQERIRHGLLVRARGKGGQEAAGVCEIALLDLEFRVIDAGLVSRTGDGKQGEEGEGGNGKAHPGLQEKLKLQDGQNISNAGKSVKYRVRKTIDSLREVLN